MAKSTDKTDKSLTQTDRHESVEKTCYTDIAKSVENLLELAKLQSTLLSHLQKNLESLKIRRSGPLL